MAECPTCGGPGRALPEDRYIDGTRPHKCEGECGRRFRA